MRSLLRTTSVAFIALASAANTPPQSTIELTPSARTAVITVNSRATTVEVAPDGSGSPIVNTSVANDLGLKGSMIAGLHMVGPTRIKADSNLAQVDFGSGTATKRRVFWFERDWTKLAEGRIGPLAMSQDIVTYRLASTMEGEREITFPMETHERLGIYTIARIGEAEVPAYFTFDRDETMLTASTGALLAQVFSGRMVGEPFPLELEMAISRPVRAMTFDTPAMLGDLQLQDIVVRTEDTGSVSTIPDNDRDPNEIVVSGGKKKKPRNVMYVGMASLKGCSTLTFDKPAELIRLSCLP